MRRRPRLGVRGAAAGLARAAVAAGLLSGCLADDPVEDNVFVSAGGSGSTTDTTAGTSTSTSATETGGEVTFPQTYRFDCIDIRGLGDGGPDVLQARLLEQAWTRDIASFKFNLMLEIVELDTDAGTGKVGIRSGVGPDASSLCAQNDTISPPFDVQFSGADGTTTYAPTNDPETCSAMSAGAGFGDFALELTPTDEVYIYAEDDTTVTFNCSASGDAPDAVPIRAVVADVSVDAAQSRLAGSLVGCLLQSEAMALCSCIGACFTESGDLAQPGDVHPDGDCMGCPSGSTPLQSLLGGIGASQRCTDLMGEPAFDLDIGFSATALPASGPFPQCG